MYDPAVPLPSKVVLKLITGGGFNQSATEQYVQVGTKITYKATVSNGGVGKANNVLLRMPIGPGTFSAAGSSPSCSLNGNAVQCTLAQLAPNASQTFSIIVSYSGCYRDPMQVATVQSDGSAPSNGMGPLSWTLVTTNCASPLSMAAKALTITRTVQVSSDTAAMTVTLKNGSTQALTIKFSRSGNSTFTDYIVKSAEPVADCGYRGDRAYGECDFTLAGGATKKLTLKLKLNGCPRSLSIPASLATVQGTDGQVSTSNTVINCTAAKRWPS